MENKKKSKRKLWKKILIFAGVIIICYFAGYFVGELIGNMENSGIDFVKWLEPIKPTLCYIILCLYGILLVAEIIYCIFNIRNAKQRFTAWDRENEKIIQKAEYSLDNCVAFSNITLILEMFLFAAWLVCLKHITDVSTIMHITMAVFYLLGFVITIWVQSSAVQLEKKINPEKSGEILDIKFQNEWIESFDEAQKMMLGQAAYKAFMTTNKLCMVLWIFCIIGILAFNFSIIPVALITIIWLTLLVSFQKTARRLEYGNSDNIEFRN